MFWGPLAGHASEYSASPAFAYQVIDGVARASARSVPGFDIHHALEAVSNKLERFGGHAAAAGFAAQAELISEITAHLETQMSWSELSTAVDERVIRTADVELELHQLGHSLWDFVDMMAPFGTGNSEPLFLIRNAVSADINYMGRNQDHVRLVLRDDTGRSFRSVGFGMADSLPPTRAVDVVVSLKTDYYRGNRRREASAARYCGECRLIYHRFGGATLPDGWFLTARLHAADSSLLRSTAHSRTFLASRVGNRPSNMSGLAISNFALNSP